MFIIVCQTGQRLEIDQLPAGPVERLAGLCRACEEAMQNTKDSHCLMQIDTHVRWASMLDVPSLQTAH